MHGAHHKVNATSTMLPLASHHRCPGHLPSVCTEGHHRITPRFIPTWSPVQHRGGAAERMVPPMPKPPFCKPKPTLCQTRAAHLTPFLHKYNGKSPIVGTAPSHRFQHGFTSSIRDMPFPHSSSICSPGRSPTKTQPATPAVTSGGEVAAGCGFILPRGPLLGAVSTSWDDSKPWETRPLSLLILDLLVCKAAAAAQRLSGFALRREVALQRETEAQSGTAPRSDLNANT